MRLGGEVVDLVGLHEFHKAQERGAVGHIGEMQAHFGFGVGVGVEVVDAICVKGAGAADEAVDFVAFGEQEFGEVGAVLAGDAGDEGDLLHRVLLCFRGTGCRGPCVRIHGLGCPDDYPIFTGWSAVIRALAADIMCLNRKRNDE